MAISFVNGGTALANNGGNPSVDMSAWSLAENDLVIAAGFVGATSDQDMAMSTAGYTEVADLYADDTEDANLGVFYKFMTATPDGTSVLNGLGGANSGNALAVQAFRGVDTAGPFDVASVTATGINTGHADPPSIDWSTAGVWVVIAGGTGLNSLVGQSYTLPTGYTTNGQTTVTGTDTDIGIVGLGYKEAPSDPEDPGLITVASDFVNFSWAAVTMALKPSAAGSQFFSVIVGA